MDRVANNIVKLFDREPNRALLVDDVTITRAVTRVFLESSGCDVVEIASVWDKHAGKLSHALTSLLGNLRLFDLVMVNMARAPADQILIVRSIKTHAPFATKIICTVPNTNRDCVYPLFDEGADIILIRPFSPSVLAGAVQRCLFKARAKESSSGSAKLHPQNRELLFSYWSHHGGGKQATSHPQEQIPACGSDQEAWFPFT